MANYLRRFARPENPKKDKTRSIRIPSEIEREFEEHCRRYGLNFNEGILLLIMHELGNVNAAQELSATKESRE